MHEIVVITRVPDVPQAGNLALPTPLFQEIEPPDIFNEYHGVYHSLLSLDFRMPVFALGEILVLDGEGREIGGRGRKPNKWDVDWEVCDTVEYAVLKAVEVVDQ